MEIRKLTQDEKFDARLISTLAFHFRMEDPEKQKQESMTEILNAVSAGKTNG